MALVIAADDHNNTFAGATNLASFVSNDQFNVSGVIEQNTDAGYVYVHCTSANGRFPVKWGSRIMFVSTGDAGSDHRYAGEHYIMHSQTMLKYF